eukprot:SAG31_NODE_298_length_18125_cov_27.373350_7_plen_96_part_00
MTRYVPTGRSTVLGSYWPKFRYESKLKSGDVPALNLVRSRHSYSNLLNLLPGTSTYYLAWGKDSYLLNLDILHVAKFSIYRERTSQLKLFGYLSR